MRGWALLITAWGFAGAGTWGSLHTELFHDWHLLFCWALWFVPSSLLWLHYSIFKFRPVVIMGLVAALKRKWHRPESLRRWSRWKNPFEREHADRKGWVRRKWKDDVKLLNAASSLFSSWMKGVKSCKIADGPCSQKFFHVFIGLTLDFSDSVWYHGATQINQMCSHQPIRQWILRLYRLQAPRGP